MDVSLTHLLSMYHLSAGCHSFSVTVIARARSSRMEGSWWLVVVLLAMFGFSLCLVSCCVLPIGLAEDAALPASSLDQF